MALVVTLILFGLILMFIEIMLIPGVGVAGILGVASMAASSVYAFVEVGATTGYEVTGINAVLLILLMVLALRAKTWERFSLNTKIEAKAVVPEQTLAVGDRGKAMTRLAPMGSVRFGDKVLEVTAYDSLVDAGQEVEVVFIDDKKVFVAVK